MGGILVEIAGDSSSLERAFRRSTASAKQFERSVSQASRGAASATLSFHGLGRAVAFASSAFLGGAGLVFALKSVTQSAIGFERAMRNVNSIARLNERAFSDLSKQVLSLAGPTAQAPKTLAEGLYDLESSGFNANESVKILAASARAATAGLTDTATSTKAVAAALNAYHLGADKARAVSDILFQTVNKGVISFEELAQQMGDLVPAAAPLGVSLEEVGAAIATITLQGVPAAEAATRVKNSLILLAKQQGGLVQLLKKAGYANGEAAVKALGYAGVLKLVNERTSGGVTATAKLAPEIRGLLGIVGLTGKNLATYESNLRSMTTAQQGAGITSRVFAEQSKSTGVQLQRLSANIEVLKIRVGNALLPEINRISDALNRWLGDSKNQELVTRDVTEVVNTLHSAIAALVPLVKSAAGAFKSFSQTLGGARRTFEVLIAAFAAWKIAGIVTKFNMVGLAAGEAGAAGKIGLLISRYRTMAALAAVPIVVDIVANARTDANRPQHGFASWSGIGGWGKFANDIVGAVTGGKGDWLKPTHHPATAASPRPSPDTMTASQTHRMPQAFGASGTGTAGTPAMPAAPATGLSSLSRAQRNALALAMARTPSQELAALTEQRAVLANQIRSVRTRLGKASGSEAKKLSDQLRDLESQDTSAFQQIASINEAAASNARESAQRIKDAAAKKKQAMLDSIMAVIGGADKPTLGVKGGALTLAQVNKSVTANEKRVREAAAAKEQAAQFRSIGLMGTGEDFAPTKGAFLKQITTVSASLRGTLLDTDPNRNRLAMVRKALTTNWKALTRDTKMAIKSFLDALDGGTKGKGFGPTGRVVTAESLTAGIAFKNLAAKKEAQARIAQALGHRGRVPTGQGVQGATVPIVLHSHVYIDGRQAALAVTNHQEQIGRHQAPQRRGPNAGRGRALP